MPSRDEYPDDAVQACFSVLVELFTYLKPYRDYIVLIGGWVPFFLTQGKTEESHIGSLDIDLALDTNHIPETGYTTILTILENRHYRPAQDKTGKIIPARYERIVQFTDGRIYPVLVDFLAPEYGGTERRHRHQKVQELLAHKARGSDLVFDNFVEWEIVGQLPNQAENRERIKIASPAACLVMKAIAFGDRSKEKDAYDLYMLCDALGVPALIAQLTPLRENKLMQEALVVLQEKFRSPNALGPVSIVDFVKAGGDDAARLKRRAFEIFLAIVAGLDG
jgi:hypothetical protein